ncbi:MAG: T9SS type A sorting domain-containing protein [Muribaculaceae bacterium]|nr:T9SS type A sorting domain-containing protein [Muribaculaceae bacterium]
MKKICTAFAVVALTATTALAAGELAPSGGAYYPDDAMNQGYIAVNLEESIDLPTATVTYGGVAHEATVSSVGFSGMSYRVNVADVMNGQSAGTAFTLSVAGLSGDYVWEPIFPLTGVSPVSGSVLDSKNQKVVFSFSPAVSYTGIRLTSGSVITNLDQSGDNVTSVTVDLAESQWGLPVGGVNSMTVALQGVTANGVSISNASGSAGTILASYSFEEAATGVTFLGVDPAEDEATAAELWDYWNVAFMFSDAVELTDEDVSAVIKFYRRGDVELEDYTITVPTSEIYADWNYRGGYYGVEVPAPEVPEDLPTTFAYLTITLQGIAYNGELLKEQPSAKYHKTIDMSYRSAAQGNIANVKESFSVNTATVNVYDVHGRLVKENVGKENILNLPAGLYIVDGKKMIVK